MCARTARRLRQVVDSRLILQEEERVQCAVLAGRFCAIEIGVGFTSPVQFPDALVSLLPQHAQRAKQDRGGGACLRTCRCHTVLLAVITKRALVGAPIFGVAVEYSERAGCDAVCAAITDIL